MDKGASATPTASVELRSEPASGLGHTATTDLRGWTLQQAVELCRQIEPICPAFGCHVALTGGALYKDGIRKDADILFYRIRQVEFIDKYGLFEALTTIGLFEVSGVGWCHKAIFEGRSVDCFFPDDDGEYEGEKADPDDQLVSEFLA